MSDVAKCYREKCNREWGKICGGGRCSNFKQDGRGRSHKNLKEIHLYVHLQKLQKITKYPNYLLINSN
jgi:hypothetical protein